MTRWAEFGSGPIRRNQVFPSPGAQSIPLQFEPLGDDALPNGGWNYVEQTYDWKGRPLVTTNQDGTTTQASYDGCGCAGEVVTLTDEGTIDPSDMVTPRKRQQKVYSDVLGRTVKTEVLNWEGGRHDSKDY